MLVNSAYVVCAASSDFRYEHAEEMFFAKLFLLEKAKESGKYIEIEYIFIEREMTHRERRRRYRLLGLLKAGKFERIVFQGDTLTPYIGALRKAVPPQTEVENKAQKDSKLDFYLQWFKFERERGTQR